MTEKSLPDATVEVIDPESGTSSGTQGSDVKLAVGDIILFRFAFTPVPDKINRGLQHWVTEYIPKNTEVVGVRIIDVDGHTLLPRYPGLGIDGCGGGSQCNTFNSLACDGGTCSFQGGSIAQVHADTGIFYATDERLRRVPADQFITTDNGIVMNPEPRTINPGITSLIGDNTGPYYAHNLWDWAQVRAFGTQSSPTSGTGNAPFLYASPVAGSDTYYIYEATDVSGSIRYNDVTGPWSRIRYPGSTIGFGNPVPSSGLNTRMIQAMFGGFDVTPANPIAGATALRYALGATRTGRPGYVEVALRVTDVPIDPDFDPPFGGNVNCGEVFGSDVAYRGGNSGGRHNPWPSYIGTPACVYLRLLFDLDVDKDLALGNETLTYTLRGKNLSVNPEHNAVVRLKYDGNRQSYQAGTGLPAPSSGPATCLDDSTKSCLTWNLGTLDPSDEYVIEAKFTVGGGGHTSNVMQANYRSTELPAPGYSTSAITIVTGIALPEVTLQNGQDPTLAHATAGSTWALTGTMANEGTNDVTMSSLTLHMPTGWTHVGSLTVGATSFSCSAGCSSNTPTFNLNLTFLKQTTRAMSIQVRPPPSAQDGLYTIDASTWASQSGFGGSFETYHRDLLQVPVGKVRTAPPTLDCPVVSTQTSITGTSEADADVSVRFNLMERGTGTADGAGAWDVSNYGAFGGMYGGLEVTATATAPGKLESQPSAACFVTAVRACSDGIDNDGDGLIDFPADPGCESPSDGDETDPVAPQCSDGIDNDGNGLTDWPEDPACASADDPTEDGVTECSDGIDNDGDGLLDWNGGGDNALIDPDCTGPDDPAERTLAACQNGIDDDGDGLIDFDGLGDPNLADPGCHSAFDDDEEDIAFSPIDVKPRLLVVFDTSGSMNWNTCEDVFTGGDGSSECAGDDVGCSECGGGTCGDGLANDSRLYKVKAGISDVVAAFGEVEYGLMRFHQRAREFSCPGTNASLGSGGWQGGGAEPCSGGFDAGDLVVSFSPDNQYTLLGWIDGDSNYYGVAPAGLDWELRGSGTTPLAGSLDSARTYLQDVQATDTKVDCRPYRVILVTDGQETCGGDPSASAAALYALGIPVYVIGFATSDQSIVDSLNAIAVAGGTGQAIVVDDEATLSAEMAAIVTESILVEVCNGLDDDCDGQIDEDFVDLGQACDNGEQGVCYAPGEIVCTQSGLGTECNAPAGTPGEEICNNLDDDCDGKVDEGLAGCDCVPQQEICNGLDDDCDGEVDEGVLPGVGDGCGIDIGECQPGTLQCIDGSLVCDGATNPTVETCNNLDDDCDTFVDEYFEECYTFETGCDLNTGNCFGQCQTGAITCEGGEQTGCVGQVGPSEELCNGLDDDCDGSIDEDFTDLGEVCNNGQMGTCYQEGVWVCKADGTGLECTAPTVTPGIEICNDLDDDCDGEVDEELGAPIGNTCGGGANCTQGVLACVDGQVVCEGSVGGTSEVCDGIDNDCDNVVDEEPLPGTGLDCTDPGYEEYADIGECEYGTTICAGGGIVCEGYVGPKPEVCNGKDDDCDGVADDFAECPAAGDLCHEGTCVRPCEAGEFPCGFGFKCENIGEDRYCVPDPCVGVQCPSGSVCDPADGQCVDLCDGVMCTGGKVCKNGFCVDCFVTGCAEGQQCKPNDMGVGQCQTDPCFGVDCEDNEFCREGQCIPVVCNPPCGAGDYCDDGQCVPDNCTGVSCPQGKQCRPSDGECVSINNCDGVSCQNGQACHPGNGTCIDDPCIGIFCPGGFECKLTLDGDATCRAIPFDDGEEIYAAGGGCACDSTGSPDPSLLLILLAALTAIVPRRRRTHPSSSD